MCVYGMSFHKQNTHSESDVGLLYPNASEKKQKEKDILGSWENFI